MTKRILYFLLVITTIAVIDIVAISFVNTEYLIYYYSIVSLNLGIVIYLFYSRKIRKIDLEVNWLEEKLNQMNQITYVIKKVGEVSINDFPFGVIMFDQEYTVKWSNNFIKQLFGKTFVNRSLNEFSEDIIPNLQQSSSSFILQLDNFTLNVEFNEEFNVLYIQDLSEISDLTVQYSNKRLSMGYLTLDNLDETLANMDVQERTKVQGSYFSKIGKWAEKNEIYVKGLSSEKFQMLFDYEQLMRLEEDEFAILNDIREISKKENFQINGSIGIACYDESVTALGERVNEALAIAFERGGDQAVVDVQGEQIKYFGGKSDTVEKRSRVKARMISGQLMQIIKESANVVIVTHKSPDHDALGSMIGMKKFVDFCNVPVALYFDYENSDIAVKKMYSSLSKDNEEFTSMFVNEIDSKIKSDTLIVVVDVNNANIIHGDVNKYDCKKVVIDHHRRGTNFVETNLSYVEPYASSSVELVVELMQFYENDIMISQAEATLMLTGIIVDTNNFSWRTGARTFDAASFLRLFGANMTDIKKYLREDYNNSTMQSRLLSIAELYLKRFGIIMTNEVLTRVQLAKLSDQLLMIDNVDSAVVIGVLEEGLVGVSARSFGDVNVQVLMEHLGGGGHLNNAAAQVEGSIEDVYVKIKNELKNLDKEV